MLRYPQRDQRPDPDALLAQVQGQEQRATRGKLRIYFGASAGVGKTCAMLNAAHKLQSEGATDILIGIVETHQRRETLALLDGLESLPLKPIEYRGKDRGKTLLEFDLDAALTRHPALILMDELAHSNAPGSRHPKRWQDVEELLAAGIDVFSTLNVQHLETLNDAVSGITGIRVAETLPDTVFDHADEVVLVDIPADELLLRLKAGKVYQAPQAARASQNFFRKGNLIALRELALRRTAERVEDDVQAYRIEQSISPVWKTDAALLACIGPAAGAEHIVRSTAQLANQLNAEWYAIYVETPKLQRLPAPQRERILKTLKLAQDLGANTAVLSGSSIATTITEYARNHNFSKIVLGRKQQHTLPPLLWRESLHTHIARHAPDIDLIEIGHVAAARANTIQTEKKTGDNARNTDLQGMPASASKLWRYLWAASACLVTTLIAIPLLPYLDLTNIVMLYLFTEILVAIRFGRGPVVMAAFLSVAAFDFFFVPPRFSFAVSDFQYLITFAVMLLVGLSIGHLAAGLRYQARIASRREARSRALYEFARELSSVLQTEQIFETTRKFIQRTFHAQATLLLPNDNGRLQWPETNTQVNHSKVFNLNVTDMGIAQWAFDRATPAGLGTDTLPGSKFLYLPLIAPMRTRGLLAIQPEHQHWVLIPEQRQQLDTFAALAAIALERMHYIEVAQNALVNMESERLRNSLLSALSHDLRTPLTSLVGLSESLARVRPALPSPQHALVEALHEEALRMNHLVTNLLDMARIQSGEVKLNLQWQPIEEVVGSALRASHSLLAQHLVQTQLAADLPLVQFDAILIERVLCNLLGNAAKYTPAGSQVVISAAVRQPALEVTVSDNGPGLPHGQGDALFEKFTRGERESATPGVGLGLAICRAIVHAHQGTIRAQPSSTGGASFVFTLPLGTPPAMPESIEI